MVLECINGSCGTGNNNKADLRFTYSGDEDDQGENDWSLENNSAGRVGGIWAASNLIPIVSLDGWYANRVHIVDNGIRIVSTPTATTDTYARNDIIEFEARFNQPVHVKAGTTPGFRFQVAGGATGARTAWYSGGTATYALRFQYTVQASDPKDTNGLWIGDSSDTWINAQGNIIAPLAAILTHEELGTQSGHKIDPTIDRPTITDIEIVSQPLFDVVGYGRDEEIKLRVTFSHDVVATGPTSMAIKVGDGQRSASYISAESSGREVFYSYTVVASDSDPNGISVPEHALAERGDPYRGLRGTGTIQKDNSGRANARVRSNGIGNDSDHRVSGNLYLLGNASLSDLSIDNVALTPVFSKDQRDYTAEVARDKEIVTIRATPRTAGATVTFGSSPDGNDDRDGYQKALDHGQNSVTIDVRSVDGNSSSQYRITIDRAAAPPDVPDKPTVTAPSPTSLHVVWTEPASNGASIENYALRYQEDGAQGWAFWPTGQGVEATISDVTPGVLYRVQISATNSAGSSDWSGSGQKEVSKPDAPERPTLTVASPTSLLVEWTEPVSNGGLTITHYRVRYKEIGTDAYAYRHVQDGTEVTLTDLTEGAYHQVSVAAVNGEGFSPYSQPAATEPAAPDAPDIPILTVATYKSLTARWTAPNDNGEPITGYAVQYQKAGASYWTNVPHSGTNPEATISELSRENTIYHVRIKATNIAGSSPWSESGIGSIVVPDQVVTLSVTVASAASLRVEWVPPADNGTAINVYGIQWRKKGSGSAQGRAHHEPENHTTIRGLSQNINYEVQVQASSPAGTGELSPSREATIRVPDTPDEPRITVASTTSLNVGWSKPEAYGATIKSYDIRYRQQRDPYWLDWPHGTTARNTKITNLVQDRQYEVQIRASNIVGNSQWSPSGDGTPEVILAENGDLQLVNDLGPTDSGQGRLEVFFQQQWGTVCNDRFDRPFADHHADPPNPNADEDGKVPNVAAQFACQNLGFRDGEMVTRPGDISIALESQKIWLDDVRCAGTVGTDGRLEMAHHWRDEDKWPPTGLHHCYHAGVGLHNCNKPNGNPDHKEDVHLQCTGELPPESATQEEATPLTASFEDLPDAHDGATAFTFRLSLSDDIANTDADVRDSAFEVSGGSVTGVGRVDGRSDLWEITVMPDVTGNIRIALLAARACGTAGALCTADGRALTTALLVVVPASPQQAGPGALTAVFADMPAEHGGATGFTFTLRFSESFPIGYVTMRDEAFTVTNGRVTRARRLDNPHHEQQGMQPNREWEITVAPGTGAGDVTITLPETTDCAATGAVCTEDGTMLSGAVSVTVPHTHVVPNAPATPPLRASFANVPAEHDGGTVFTFEVRFSEAFPISYLTMRDHALTVTNARVTRAQRLDNPHHEHQGMQPNRTWKISVSPDAASEDVTIVLPTTTSCDASGAVCTGDGRKLSNTESATVAGPPSLSIADAQVDEAADAMLEFTVSLSRAASETVTVDWATADGTATAGSDYTADSGTLTFAPDETSKTVAVAVLDDAHDEGSETLTVTLSNPSGAYLADGEATGTIENSDHMPAAWLSRFGRTVAEQIVDAAKTRLAGPPNPGTNLTIAGLALTPGGTLDVLELDESTFGERNITGRDLLTGSSFSLATGTANGGTAGIWGRGVLSRFSGTEEDLSLNGDVTSLLLGADWAQERSTLGAMVSHTRATGSYQGADAGRVESDLTGLYPYGQLAMSSRVSLWAVAGYGAGTLSLTPDGQPSLETDIDLAMAAAGVRSVLLEATTEGGPELAAVTDVMGVQTNSDAVRDDEAGNLAAAKTEVSRVRLGVEGTWMGLKLGDADLKPTLELGVRRDGGDAETGLGIDVGAGFAWSNPRTGLSATVHARGLLTHESDAFRDQGLSASLGWDPHPTSDRGLSLRLTQTAGAPATGGMHSLLSRTTLEGLDLEDRSENPHSVELGLGYGVPAFDGLFTATPEFGFRLSDRERRYRLGWKLGLRPLDQRSMELRLDLTRTERPGTERPSQQAGITLTSRW